MITPATRSPAFPFSVFLVLLVSWCLTSSLHAQPRKVTIDPRGNFLVDEKPFFPLAIWLYELSPNVMKDIKSKGFNTVVGNGFNPDQLDFLHQNQMMAVPMVTEPWLKAGIEHPAILAWYIVDEPEGHGNTPEDVKKAYDDIKKRDPNHPAGMCHFLYDAFDKYKDAGDFTMSDVYPVTANRDVPLRNVGIHMDRARSVRAGNPNFPIIPFIQIFGGPDTDGGKWAQPNPTEVRCMTFIGLVHRPSANFVFSYWAKHPPIWDSMKGLNAQLSMLSPLLLADGTEMKAASDKPAVEIRARKLTDGRWLILAVNTERAAADVTLSIDQLGDTPLSGMFGAQPAKPAAGKIAAHFAPLEVKVYTAGKTPG